jgi:PadR family transcriptional regulator PadR
MEVETALLGQLRRGVVEYCVMALLAEEERYGYDLVTALSDAGLVASTGSIYPLLSRLRRNELVETTWRESPDGPPRRYYRLTEQGRVTLERFRTAWRDFSTSVDSILEGGRS